MTTTLYNDLSVLSLKEQVDAFMLVPMHSRSYRMQLTIKCIFDRIAAFILLLILSPLLVVIAILVKWHSPGPIFYRSLRVGKDHKPFCMLKFRTMVQNADFLRAHLRHTTAQENRLFKLEYDPRVTPWGRILRKFSLDELPQLLNVLHGDMSLVGPRPLAPDDCTLYEPPHTLRFKAIPGMTGLWQVSGRSLLEFEEACLLDTRYVLEWNLLKDVMILCQTLPTVCFNTGAYKRGLYGRKLQTNNF